jgi:hypothetical protein
MTTTTINSLGPVLVSELPPAGEQRHGIVARLRADLGRRRVERAFERALREADPGMASDLYALNRRR